MPLHKDLTGAELHEPKGIDSATSNEVYVSDGLGSGAWQDVYTGHLIRNKYWLTEQVPDISTANSKTWFFVDVQSEIVDLACILQNAITTANATLSIYINGVLFADSLIITQAGSTAGSTFKLNATTANTIPANSTIEIRSDGGSDTACIGYITLGLRAK